MVDVLHIHVWNKTMKTFKEKKGPNLFNQESLILLSCLFLIKCLALKKKKIRSQEKN
jgi:hypothetical protein